MPNKELLVSSEAWPIEQFEADLRRAVRIVEPTERLKLLADLVKALDKGDGVIKLLMEFGLQSTWVVSTLEGTFSLRSEERSQALELFLTILDEKIVLYTRIAERFAKDLTTSDPVTRWPYLYMQSPSVEGAGGLKGGVDAQTAAR